MNPIDERIIQIMAKNARITMKELSEELGLSAPAVAERVKRLETTGVIQGYRAVVDRSKLGQGIVVFVNIDMPASLYKKFQEFAANAPEVGEYYYVTGQYSLIVKAYVSTTQHLAKLLEKMQAFGTTETFVVMYEAQKDTYF